jgi:hypothetical protein
MQAPQTPAIPGAGGIDAQLATADALRGLQAQTREIDRQLQSLLNRRENMVGRLDNASPQQTAAIHGEIAALDGQISHVQGSLMELTARAAELRTNATFPQTMVPPPPPMNPFHMIDPDAVTAVFVMFSIGIILPLSIGLTRRMWRRPPTRVAPRESDMMASPRLERLEQAVDAIAIEIERISEGQRFVTKVLSERPVQGRSGNAGDAKDASALGDAKPFLALGAGPVEPIRAGERQAVRQSITPH